ncbi:hypothetical protein [Ktedonospora formicarum]|uniref:Uncharacterized protein n=1 Tax=Ktedonospora formicarum TaxID=2778364 RepID=A0A8J3I8M0_9CHLR|nr:hypothetical protein [Ktedonospora formicarum]GHO49223.1 hypothetical protein KSX_73860 [Ktedonospora formicarum]
MTDLSKYFERILTEEDRPLFQEAVLSALHGAPRGAYILIWIACAEGIKHKFREAVVRDGRANKAIKRIEQAESNHSSADIVILDEAKQYGFIDDFAYQKLENVYKMRCVYGHPYGTAPSDEELASAAAVVVGEVLGKPTLLKHGFVQTLIDKLFSDVHYLEHSEESVRSFAREMSTRIATMVYGYLLEKYVEMLEPSYDDASLQILIERGSWFLNEFLLSVGCDFYSAEQWHNFVSKYPITTHHIILTSGSLFEAVGVRANDYIVSYSVTYADTRPSRLKRVEQFSDDGLLSNEQKQKLQNVGIETIKAANLKISTSYATILAALKSHDWYKQNPAIKLIAAKSRSEIAALLPEQQEELGRNILQVAEGGSSYASLYMSTLQTDPNDLSTPFLRGIIFEAFVNERLEFRFKEEHIAKVLNLLVGQKDIEEELAEAIDASKLKTWISKRDYQRILDLIKNKLNLNVLAKALERNREKLTSTDDW